jgi:heme exporter protein A
MKKPLNINLTAEQLAKRFSSGWIFRGVSFRARPGESLAITGPNGSGKSTLCEILGGLRRESAGRLTLAMDGETLSAAQRRALLGFASPRLSLYGDLTAGETLAFVCTSLGAAEGHARALCARFGLERHMVKPVRHFSSGMRQRLKIALALAHEPPVLLLDEPGMNLDADGKEVLAAIIREMLPSTLLVIATNEESEASLCSGRVSLA